MHCYKNIDSVIFTVKSLSNIEIMFKTINLFMKYFNDCIEAISILFKCKVKCDNKIKITSHNFNSDCLQFCKALSKYAMMHFGVSRNT